MNLYVCGFIDIVLIVSFLAFIIIGYKEGFMTKVLNIAKGFGGVFVSLFLVVPFGKLFYNISFIRDPIFNKVEYNVSQKITCDLATASTEEVLGEIGVPGFMRGILINNLNLSDKATDVVYSVSDVITKLLLYVIAFLILIFIFTIGIAILKLIVKGLRKTSKFITIVDGIFGIVFGACLFLAVAYIGLLVISIVLQTTGADSNFAKFITVDMQLNTNSFRISKFLYNNNVIGMIIGIFIN